MCFPKEIQSLVLVPEQKTVKEEGREKWERKDRMGR
jgi:hypothetical protein